MKYSPFYFSLISLGLLIGCQYDFPDEITENPSSGQADFTKMISVGNSLTAGFMDGALYDRGQENSFVEILAEQMKAAGGGEFNTPAINSENGFFSQDPGGSILGRLVLTMDPNTGDIAPAPIGSGDLPAPYSGDKSALNNFGVPGVTLGTALIPDTGDPSSPLVNPLYLRFATNPGTSTLIGDAAAALADGGTFFTFWLGNNDVLGYATGGASNPGILTNAQDFQARLNLALGSMLGANSEAKGVVLNIPGLNSLPHFDLINPLSINVPASVRPALNAGLTQINAAINGWNGAVAANPEIPEEVKPSLLRPVLSTDFDAYALLILDPSLSDAVIPLPTGGTFEIPKIRNLTEDDGVKIPLGGQADLGQGVGISPLTPLNEVQYDHVYLTLAEQEEITAHINSFNNIISAAVSSNGDRLLLVDANAYLNEINQGLVSAGGIALTSSIIPPNGAFSVDGIHPNARAHAFLANYIIDGINAKWQANIRKTNPNAFPGNDLPR